ncbi:MAG: FKBP-type peptidyl-prolyl cis-trans isomerase [Planctomycetota bacterium]
MILEIVWVMAAPAASEDKDYTSLPPEPAATFERVSAIGTSVAPAIELVQRATGGVVRAAQVDLAGVHPTIRLEVCARDATLDVVVDAADGKIVSQKTRGRFPGDPVDGKWIETGSGLKYFELAVGSGAQPKSKATRVKVHYTGWLVDGTKFDSSFDRGEAYITPLNQVIAGWSEGVLGMKVGGKRKLIIPYDLGYGVEGTQGIPGRATLIFDVELMEILDELPPSPEAQRLEAIQAANQQLMRAFRAGDLKGVAAMYADDAVLLGPNQLRIEGRKAIDDYWAGLKHPVDWQLEVLSLDGQDDLVHQIGRSVLTTEDDQGKCNRAEVLFAVIWRRQQDGSYKVAVDAYWPAG